ncbi:MAG: hypothetical protein FWG43_02610 [Clostridiales bacterium]|nr:hypothetical protein [Clostridiales bacterium]
MSLFPGINGNDLAAAALSVALKDGTPLYEAECLYATTGVNSYSYAYGDMENTAEYFIGNRYGKFTKSYSLYITNFSSIILPENITIDNSFQVALNTLGITDQVLGRDDDRYFSVTDETDNSTIGIAFWSWHGIAENTDLATAWATLYYSQSIENQGVTYRSCISLTYREGRLENIQFDLDERCDEPEEPEIQNNRVGITFLRSEYQEKQGSDCKVKLEKLYYEDEKIYMKYGVKANEKIELIFNYVGWASADNAITEDEVSRSVKKGEQKILVSLNERTEYTPQWYKSIYESYLHITTHVHAHSGYPSYFDAAFDFFEGNISIYRGESR